MQLFQATASPIKSSSSSRYYNVDFFVGGKSKRMGDPIKNWHAKVGAPILELPYVTNIRVGYFPIIFMEKTGSTRA